MMTEGISEVVGAVRRLGVTADAYGPTLNTDISPPDVEAVGRALAVAVAEHQPDLIAVWHSSDDAVLAHVVARELGASVLRAAELEGVLSFQLDPEPGCRVALLATVWQSARRLDALRSLTNTRGLQVATVAAVLRSEPLAALRQVPTVGLLEANDAVTGGMR